MDVELIVGLPTVEELQRVVDEYFDAQPLSTAYAVFEGDGPRDGKDLSEYEQGRAMHAAVRYMWLSAARKRVEKP
jgi:hypothetical protein